MLPIIDRYIIKEASKSFLAIATVLLLIVTSQSYSRRREDAASGLISADAMMSLLGLEVLQVLGPIIPPTFFFAILYTLGRMYRDNEVTALSSGGIGTLRIYRAFAMVAIPAAMLVAWLTLELVPWVNENKVLIMQQQKQESVELGAAVAGRFNEFSHGDMVFYVEDMSEDKTKLRNIFVQNRQNQHLGLITATEGYQQIDEETGGHYLILTDGYRYEGEPGRSDYTLGQFEKYAILVGGEKEEDTSLPVKALPTETLMVSTDIREQSELQYRLMFPVAILVFALVSVPLSKSMPREGIYGRLVLAILFYFLFLNLQAVSGNWMVAGTTPPWLGRWWVHPVMLFFGGVVMLYKSPRMARELRRRIWVRKNETH